MSFTEHGTRIKALQSHIEGHNHDLSQLRQDNMKLKALILDREAKLNSVKEEYALQLDALQLDREAELNSCEIETRKEEETQILNQSKDRILIVQSTGKEFEDEKDVLDSGSIQEEQDKKEADTDEKSATDGPCLSKKTTPWKMDLHALGVSYKIKRLKHQLVMLEKVTGKQESCEDRVTNDNTQFGIKGFNMLVSMLNKQVSRYQSLQGKTDDFSKRMHEIDLVSFGGSTIAKTREETKTLEHFQEKTFQLQRYMVATCKKLMEIQSKIASGLVGAAEALEGPASFDMKCFADSVRTLFKEVYSMTCNKIQMKSKNTTKDIAVMTDNIITTTKGGKKVTTSSSGTNNFANLMMWSMVKASVPTKRQHDAMRVDSAKSIKVTT
ncbi:uncharacterized protein LOC132313948 [Cornus florida]|uniref:uncharacterized protein LOC132313948 n=1 Tax=Cornus florida TaxID=4283 RepID=UPI0028A0AB73|nr:uncharacterized protein LOC132313948 [Cornus florida]